MNVNILLWLGTPRKYTSLTRHCYVRREPPQVFQQPCAAPGGVLGFWLSETKAHKVPNLLLVMFRFCERRLLLLVARPKKVTLNESLPRYRLADIMA